jgi:excisionase family DNA binding protein
MTTFKTINEICAEYGVVRATVVSWIKSGKLKAIRLHTQYRIPVTEWELFVKSSSNQE